MPIGLLHPRVTDCDSILHFDRFMSRFDLGDLHGCSVFVNLQQRALPSLD